MFPERFEYQFFFYLRINLPDTVSAASCYGLFLCQFVSFHPVGQVFGTDRTVGTQYHGTLYGILEVADIAGPAVRAEQLHGFRCNGLYVEAQCPVIFADKEIGQQRNVLFPFAKWREDKGKNVQAVEKVETETAVFHFIVQVAVGSCYDTDIYGDCLLPSYTGDFSFFQYAE